MLSICIERNKDKEWNKQRKEREREGKKEILTDTKKNIETEINFCFNLQRVNVGNKWIDERDSIKQKRKNEKVINKWGK